MEDKKNHKERNRNINHHGVTPFILPCLVSNGTDENNLYKYTVPRSRNSFICTRENNFLYSSKLCHGEKGMTTHAPATSAIYNSQMSGVKMPDDLHVSMLIVY